MVCAQIGEEKEKSAGSQDIEGSFNLQVGIIALLCAWTRQLFSG